jgi:PEP-CTERM motif
MLITRKRAFGALAFLGVVLMGGGAQATPVTWQASGVVTDTWSGGGYFLPFAVSVGDSFTYTFTFDDATPDTYILPGSTYFGKYEPLLGASISVGGSTFDIPFAATGRAGISVQNDYPDSDPRDQWTVYAYELAGSSIGSFVSQMTMWTVTASNVLTSDALPGAPPDPLEFAYNNFTLQYLESQYFDDDGNLVQTGSYFNGKVSSIVAASAAPVPEPSTFALFGVALGLMGMVSRRRHDPVQAGRRRAIR